MPFQKPSRARTVGLECLEPRRLFALSLSPLQSATGVRFESVATDTAGNIFAVGEFQGKTTFDKAGKITLSPLGDSDAFIMRVAASNGSTVVRRLGSSSAPSGLSKLVSTAKVIVRDGHVTVIGNFTGQIDLDPTSGVHSVQSQGDADGFVLDLSASTLAYNWSTSFGGGGSDQPQALQRDSAGNTWITGFFQSTLKFAGTPTHSLKSSGSFDSFIVKFGPAGQYRFSTKVGGKGDDVLRAVAIDSHDNVFLAGSFQKTVDTNPGSSATNVTTANSTTSGMLIELTSTGVFKASRGYIDTGFGTVTDLEIDSKDSLYVLGNFDGTIDVDGSSKVQNLTSKGFGDIWIGKVDAKLNPVWNYGIGAGGTDQAYDMFVDSAGQVLVSGNSQGPTDFNPAKATAFLNSDGGADAFLASYNSAGKFLGAAQMGGAGGATIIAMARTKGAYVAATNFQGAFDLTPRPLPAKSPAPVPKLLDTQGKVLGVLSLIAPAVVGSK